MRLPIRFNLAGWPRCLMRRFATSDPRPLAYDPSALSPAEFSGGVTALQFDGIYKTTYPGRHEQSTRFVAELYRQSTPVILDVGASDGSTSVDLIRALGSNFGRYFVTDLTLSALCGYDSRGIVYFLDKNGQCMLRASNSFIVYSNTKGAWAPLALFSNILMCRYRNVANWHDVLLIQPELLRLSTGDQRITIERYDMFTPWTGPRPDLIKVANLLTSEYFSDAQIREALRVQYSTLARHGRLLLIAQDNGVERFSVFRKRVTGMELEHAYAGGVGQWLTEAAVAIVEEIPGQQRVTLGADKGYDRKELLKELRAMS